jgi:hypothetical protein
VPPGGTVDEDTRQEIVDGEQLRILRMGYFIAAGMTAFAGLFGFLYMFLGFFVISNLPKSAGQPEFPTALGKFFGVFGLIFAVVFLSLALLQFLAGQRLKAKRSRIFCMIIAGVTCLSIPVGTFLVVCTFIVLSRASVARTFREA